jgi:hypothetical protein
VPGAKPSTATDTVIVQLLELQTGQIFGKIPDHESVSDLTFASNGAMLAFVARDRGRDSVVVWDTVRGRRVAKLDGLPEQEAQLNDCRFLPNSNILAVAENRARIVFFAIPSCRRLGTIEHVQVDAFAFCPDGCELVVGDRDAVAGWHLDRNKLRGSAPAKSPVQTKEPPITKEALSRSYDALAGFDAHRAMEAIAQLCSAPGEASAFIAEKMQPATVDRVQVARWIGELDSNDPAIRENACKGLERIALAACGQLRKAEESAVSLEVRLKLHRILADTQEYRIRDVECIRALRAIQCLEVIGGEKARAALARLSEGEPESIITREAKAAAMRLADWLQAD